jgi:hypothetical protein
VHGRSGEQAFETPSVEILHRETGDKVFAERLGATARLHSSSSSPICVLFIRLDDINLYPWATTMMELLLRFRPSHSSYLTLVLVSFTDLLDVFVCLYMVKLTNVY